jgi:hypothetical protein
MVACIGRRSCAPGRADDQRAYLPRFELSLSPDEFLKNGDDKCKRFARSGNCLHNDVLVAHEKRDSRCLYGCHLHVPHGMNRIQARRETDEWAVVCAPC